MAKSKRSTGDTWGSAPPALGRLAPVLLGLPLALVACGEEDETLTLDPVTLGMSADLPATYDDGELTMYEVKRPVALPIVAPDERTRSTLRDTPVEPYGRAPWVGKDDVEVQVTWTLSNLDDEAHDIEILIDPWNEFGRYWPGLALVDPDEEEVLPNFSGIRHMYHLPGVSAGDASRVHGTYTYADMEELAIDFATVINIIRNAPADDGGSEYGGGQVGLVNHAFHPNNRSYRDPLSEPWIPGIIAGLTGFDLGLRSYVPANVAVEILVEITHPGTGRILEKDQQAEPLGEPREYFTVGFVP